jgi:phosphate transport system substrate-binding protein
MKSTTMNGGKAMKIRILLTLVFLLSAAAVKAEEKLVIGGSGSLTDEIQDVAKAYMAKNPGVSIQVLMDSMSSSGGMEGVKVGRLTIGLVTREPRGEEKDKLVYRAVGRTPVGVAVHKSLPVTNLTEAQVCDIFGGKIKSWKDVGGSDAKITVLSRNKDDVNFDTMKSRMACFKDTHITDGAVVLIRGSEVLDALDRRPGMIGIVNVAASLTERQNVKALSIGGVAPTVETVRSGKYKLYAERGVVTLGQPQGTVKKFLDFAAGPEAQKLLTQRGLIPVM